MRLQVLPRMLVVLLLEMKPVQLLFMGIMTLMGITLLHMILVVPVQLALMGMKLIYRYCAILNG